MNEPLRPPTPPAPPTPPPVPGLGTRSKEEKIITIPDSYYGVAVHMQPPFFTDDEQPASPAVPVPPPPPTPLPPAVASAAAPLPPEHGSRLAMAALVVVLLLAAGGGWVYWNRATLFAKPVAPTVVVQAPAIPNAPSDLAATSTAPGSVRVEWQDRSESESGFRIERQTALDTSFIPLQTLPTNSRTFLDQSAPPDSTVQYRVVAFNATGEVPAQAPVTVRVQAMPVAAPSQPSLPPDGLDLDSDGLTDVEERLYGSNGQLPDSDTDGYLDGNEVFNLYSPVAAAPATLLGSALMQSVSSTVGWQTMIPRSWLVESSVTSSSVIIRIPTGELVVVRVEENPDRQDIRSWLMQKRGWRSDQIYELLSNKYKVPFFLGADRLTGYVAWEEKVLAISYQLGTQSFVNYRTTFGLMLNALRLTGSPNVPDLSSPSSIPSIFQPQPVTSTSSSPGVASMPAPALSSSASSTAATSTIPSSVTSSRT